VIYIDYLLAIIGFEEEQIRRIAMEYGYPRDEAAKIYEYQ